MRKKEDDYNNSNNKKQGSLNKYGDGVAWFRGELIGKGSFGCVYLATLKNPKSKYGYFPSVMAVKSAEVSVSGSIQKEGEVLNNVKGCSNIIQCYGEETTTGQNGLMVFNLLLEYGSGGTLADRIKKFGDVGLNEFEVRGYTKNILEGLSHIHCNGYVHCDLKPENILLVNNSCKGGVEFRAKIGDFGLAKRVMQSKKRKLEPYFRGTPLYLSPEAVEDCVQESPCDVWALGCTVLEMLTGKPPWYGGNLDTEQVLKKIGEGHELPKIPSNLSKDAKSFLKGCFVRKAMYRLTADMLLNHPFVEGLVDDDDGPEEFPVVEDVLGVESILFVAETDDDVFSYDSQSDKWEYASDEDDFYCCSGDDVEDFVDNVESTFSEEGMTKEELLNIADSRADAKADHITRSTITVPSQGNSNSSPQYPVNLTIRAGV
ncbi:hypothetical protein Leryth_003026 [Lithospermum erythrorhizon]|nr:hypothetical protein Leryth_003026 [Lithospermum erythrorhizon]